MKLIRTICTTIALLAAGAPLADSALHFDEAWSPAAPPGRAMAGYVAIHNHSTESISLVGGSSPLFERVEIHTMRMDDGVMRMRRLAELVVESGETVKLQPGGIHLMLIAPQEPVRAGDSIEIELIDSEGRSHHLSMLVRQRNH